MPDPTPADQPAPVVRELIQSLRIRAAFLDSDSAPGRGGGGMSQPLSPAAQAVDRAIADSIQLLGEIEPSRQIAAAALRAAADQVVPEPPDCGPAFHDYIKGTDDRQKTIRFRLLAIAAELEGCNG